MPLLTLVRRIVRRMRSAVGARPALVGVLLVTAACGPADEQSEPPVRSHLSGRITVDPAVDSIPDYAGFEVLVARADSLGLDTLGFAVTDTSGRFAMDVAAPERGVYPLRLRRRGVTLRTDRLAVAEGDTATLTAELPMPATRPLRIRSTENAAWMAYLSARDAYERERLAVIRGGGEDAVERLGNQAMQTSNLLWSLREQFPGTIGADVSAAEAVVLLDGWDDALLVERALALAPDNPGFVDAARAARRAEARRRGQRAALALLDTLAARADADPVRAALGAERVVARLDSLEADSARRAAEDLRRRFPETEWAEWAERTLYDIDHLLPGRPAPDLSFTTLDGQTLSLADLRGRYVVLEFYDPHDPLYRRQLGLRGAVAEELGDSLTLVSVSLEVDTSLARAFLDGRDLPGLHVVAPGGPDGTLARRYNIRSTPTRFLVDPQGILAGTYVGRRFGRLPRDLGLLRAAPPPAPPS